MITIHPEHSSFLLCYIMFYTHVYQSYALCLLFVCDTFIYIRYSTVMTKRVKTILVSKEIKLHHYCHQCRISNHQNDEKWNNCWHSGQARNFFFSKRRKACCMSSSSSSHSNMAECYQYTDLLWNPVGPASRLPDKLALMQEPAIAWWLAESRSLQQSSRMTPTRSRWLPLALRLFVIPTDISPMLGPMLGLIARCPSVSTTLRVSPAATTAQLSIVNQHSPSTRLVETGVYPEIWIRGAWMRGVSSPPLSLPLPLPFLPSP